MDVECQSQSVLKISEIWIEALLDNYSIDTKQNMQILNSDSNRQCKAEGFTDMLEEKNKGMEAVWKWYTYLYILEDFLYKKVNEIIRFWLKTKSTNIRSILLTSMG